MKSVVDQTLELMEATFGDTFKTYYTGDPDVIPVFNLPCVIVTQTRDDTTEGQQGEDDVTDTIVIKLVLNKADDYTGNSIDPLNLTEKRLRDYVSSIGDDGLYAPKTVKYALRNVLLEGDVEAVAPTMSIEYGLNPRNSLGKASNVEWTTEAWVTFTTQHSVETYS